MAGKKKLGGVLASVQPSYLSLTEVPGAFVMAMQTLRIQGFGLAQVFSLRMPYEVKCPACGTACMSFRTMNVPFTIGDASAERPAFSLVCEGHQIVPAERGER